MNELGKRVVLATIEVGTSTAAYFGGLSLINRVRPSLLKIRDDISEKEMLIDSLKVIGITVGLAIGAAIVAGYAREIAENNLWPEISDTTIE